MYEVKGSDELSRELEAIRQTNLDNAHQLRKAYLKLADVYQASVNRIQKLIVQLQSDQQALIVKAKESEHSIRFLEALRKKGEPLQ